MTATSKSDSKPARTKKTQKPSEPIPMFEMETRPRFKNDVTPRQVFEAWMARLEQEKVRRTRQPVMEYRSLRVSEYEFQALRRLLDERGPVADTE